MNNLDQLRERFEVEFFRLYNHYPKQVNGVYMTMFADGFWKGYQAAHISAVKQCAEIANSSVMTSWNAETDAHNECATDIREAILALLPKENGDE